MTEEREDAEREDAEREETRTRKRRSRAGPALGALLVCGAVAAGVLYVRAPALPDAPLAAVPASATGALDIDVLALRRSRLWARFGTDVEASIEGLRERCGFDPVAGLSKLTAFAEGERRWSLEHVAFVARGSFDHAALAECVESVVAESGSPLIEMEMQGVPAVAGRGDSRAAFVGASGLVIGHEAAVERTLATALAGDASLHDDDAMRSLYERLAPGQELVFVGRVPPRWRDAAARAAGDASLLADLRHLGIGARVSRGLAFGALLDMGSPENAERVVAHLRGAIDELLGRTLVSLSALGPALRRINLDADGSEVNIAAEYDDARVERLLELAEQFESGWQAMQPQRPRPRAEPREPLEPDEVLRPSGGGE